MSTSRGEGTEAYRDPISFKNHSYRRGKESDIFSLGVILWEISSGKMPCDGHTQSHEVAKYREKGFRDSPSSEVPEVYIKLYSDCWNEDPDKRPSCIEVHIQLKLLSEIQHYLNQCSSGESLYLSGNKIGVTQATALAKVLESNSSLTSLYLSFNDI